MNPRPAANIADLRTSDHALKVRSSKEAITPKRIAITAITVRTTIDFTDAPKKNIVVCKFEVLGRARTVTVLVLLWFVSDDAAAGMPFYTDDPGVTDLGTLHVELSNELDVLQSVQYPDLRQNTATVKVNLGLPYGIEFDIDAPYIAIDRSAGSPNARGIGDTNLGLKWSLRESSAVSREPGFAVSFYTEFPTGNAQKELGSGLTDYWLNFISDLALSNRTRLDVNVGILFAGNTSTGVVGIGTTRGRVYVGGLSLTHDVSSRFSLGGEIYGGTADRAGLDRTQLQALFGAQYLAREGMTLSLGVLSGTFPASPRLGAVMGIALDFPLTASTKRDAATRHIRTVVADSDHLGN